MRGVVRLALFGVLAVVQLAVPAWMIAEREIVVTTGREFKFRTAPIDPYDAFRGRYVALRYDREARKVPRPPDFDPGKQYYVSLEEGGDGFAHCVRAHPTPPENMPYIEAPLHPLETDKATVQLPFDRYYLDETLAPEAERLHRKYSRQRFTDTYVTVRIKNGRAVLDELYIQDTPVVQFVRQELEKQHNGNG